MTNREAIKRCPILYGSEIWAILCVLLEKINNMLLHVKIMLIFVCVMYEHGNCDEWKLYVGNIIIQNL